MIPGFWKWRLTHMNLHRNACALEATHGEGKESFEAAMDLSLKAADEGDQRRSWFWWKVANELIRMRQRRWSPSSAALRLRSIAASKLSLPSPCVASSAQALRCRFM
jgi:hypothetical protein